MDDLTKKRVEGFTTDLKKTARAMEQSARSLGSPDTRVMTAALVAYGVPADRVPLITLPWSLLLIGAQLLTDTGMNKEQILAVLDVAIADARNNKVSVPEGGCSCDDWWCPSRLEFLEEALYALQAGYTTLTEFIFCERKGAGRDAEVTVEVADRSAKTARALMDLIFEARLEVV